MRRHVLLCISAVTFATTACGDPFVVLGESPGIVRNVAGIGDSAGSRIDTTATKSRLTGPTAVAFNDATATLYVADRGSTTASGGITSPVMRILSVTSAGRIKLELNSGGCTAGGICTGEATDMLLGDGNTLIIADAVRSRVTSFNPDTHVQATIAGTGEAKNAVEGATAITSPLNVPAGLAMGLDGTLYISERVAGRVLSIGSDGRFHVVAGGGSQTITTTPIAATSARLGNPSGLALRDGVLYIADNGLHYVYGLDLATNQIVRVTGNGVASYGGDEGPAIDARINGPRDLAISPDGGSLYISDTGNHRVRSISFASGVIHTYMGSGLTVYNGDRQSAGNISLRNPMGLTTSPRGFLFVADQGHAVVRRAVTGF